MATGFVPAHAQEASETQASVQMPAPAASDLVPERRGFAVYLNAWPFPVLSEGLGGAIEYRLTPQFSLWVGAEREGHRKTMDTVEDIALHADIVATNQFAGAGYKWSNVEVKPRTDDWILFMPDMSQFDRDYGVGGTYATLGYRLQGVRNRNFDWTLDLSVSYEPGQVKTARGVVDARTFGVASAAHLETDFGYGFFPEARLGMQF